LIRLLALLLSSVIEIHWSTIIRQNSN
jgi:hypothetical protein